MTPDSNVINPRVGFVSRVGTAALALAVATPACAHPALMDGPLGVSFGAPSNGYQQHATRFPARGVGFEVLRSPAQGGQAYGTVRLVRAIEHAALAVRRSAPGGAPLRVGDLSARRGGHIERHASHRSGRDADLIFYALDAQGRSVPAPTFVRYDTQGASLDPAHPLRFDTRRNWALIEALVADTDDGVMRIFCADRLRALLIAYAREHDRDATLIARAEEMLRQPSDSAAHDDHFHVRVACTPRERASGCRDGGPIWWWLAKAWDKSDSATADDQAVLAELNSELPAERMVDLAREGAEQGTRMVGSGATLRAMRQPLAFATRGVTEARE